MDTKEIDGVKYIPYDEHQKTVIMAIRLEREACANLCEKLWDGYGKSNLEYSEAIRARGE